MKNTIKLLGIAAIIAVIGFSFAACGNGTTDTHTHTWGAWQSNAAQHWKECDCGEEYGRASHTGTPCSVCGFITASVNLSLDGVWQLSGGTIVSISGSTGVFTQISTTALWQDAISKGYVKVGDQNYRNLTKTGDLTWTGQNLRVQYYPSSPNVAVGTNWGNCTITMNANGQTFTDGSNTWTRQ
jgi:hypothetical protein